MNFLVNHVKNTLQGFLVQTLYKVSFTENIIQVYYLFISLMIWISCYQNLDLLPSTEKNINYSSKLAKMPKKLLQWFVMIPRSNGDVSSNLIQASNKNIHVVTC